MGSVIGYKKSKFLLTFFNTFFHGQRQAFQLVIKYQWRNQKILLTHRKRDYTVSIKKLWNIRRRYLSIILCAFQMARFYFVAGLRRILHHQPIDVVMQITLPVAYFFIGLFKSFFESNSRPLIPQFKGSFCTSKMETNV